MSGPPSGAGARGATAGHVRQPASPPSPRRPTGGGPRGPTPVGDGPSGHGAGRSPLPGNRRHAGAGPCPHGPVVAAVLLDLVLDDVGHVGERTQLPRGRGAGAPHAEAGPVAG